MSDALRQIDNRVEVITPENIAFEYRLAGPFVRFIAYAIDVILRLVVIIIFMVAVEIISAPMFSSAWGIGPAAALILYFALDWFYGGVCETFFNGQTIGKHVMRIRVLSTNGQAIDGVQAMLRNFLRTADSFPFLLQLFFPLYSLGLVAMASNRRYQRLGDWAAGTMVVIEDRANEYGVIKQLDREALELAALLPARLEISRTLGKALSSYVQRRPRFPPARREEIARHLADPLRARWGLPSNIHADLLLCAVYYRAFVADVGAIVSGGGNPFNAAMRAPAGPAAPQPTALPQLVMAAPQPADPGDVHIVPTGDFRGSAP